MNKMENIQRIQPQTVYRHFKGNYYLVLSIAEHTERKESLVIYQALYGEKKTYARPLDMFLEKVPEEKKNPTGQTYRFERVMEIERQR